MKNKRFGRMFWGMPAMMAIIFNGQLYAATPVNPETDAQNPTPVISADAAPSNSIATAIPPYGNNENFLSSNTALSTTKTRAQAKSQVSADGQPATVPTQPMNLASAQLNNLQQIGTGPRVNAREASSFYAHPLGSYLRDENGRLHLTYPGSGKYYDGTSQNPEWQVGAKNAGDRILYTYSDDNGQTWSQPVTIIEGFRNPDGSQKTEQGACTNTLVKYGDYYYLIFEGTIPGNMTVGVFSARSKTIGGNYEIYTEKGWAQTTNGQTAETWKPIITPTILKTAEGQALAMRHLHTATNQIAGNDFWGAGVPTARVENGKIVLDYYDTTHGYTPDWTEAAALLQWNQSRMQVEITLDGSGNLQIGNERAITGEAQYTGAAQAVYFPEIKQYLMFTSERVNNGSRKIFLRASPDGISWGPKREIGSYPEALTRLEQMGQGQARYDIRVLTDMNGNGKLSDLRLILGGDYVFPVQQGPFAGFGELYEFKANLSFKTWDSDGNGIADAFDLNGDNKPDAWSNRPGGQINMWDSNNDGKADKFDTNGDGAPDNFDTNFDGKMDAWSSRSDGKINMWDQNGDGKADAFDLNGDGRSDAWSNRSDGKLNMWDSNRDGRADKFDTNGDGIVDNFDTDFDGKVDAWSNRPDGKINMWDVNGDGKADVFDVDGDAIVDWGSGWHTFTAAQIAYMNQRSIRYFK